LHSFKWFSVGKGSPGVNEDSMRWTFACTITYNVTVTKQTVYYNKQSDRRVLQYQ